jgi:hypothetical protein
MPVNMSMNLSRPEDRRQLRDLLQARPEAEIELLHAYGV